MNPLIITAILTAITVSSVILITVVKPAKLIPFILSVYFAVIVLITK